MNFSRTRCALGLLLVLASACAHAQVDITSGGPALQNFDTLANTGSTNTTLPAGWQLAEPGSNGQYVASNGSGAGLSGSVYSFGTTGSSERALGTVASGTTAPIIGAQLRNATGSVLSGLRVAFTMEQWRLGTPGAADRLTFAYSTDATSITTGTWTAVPQLDAVAIVTAGTAESALDGNAPANRTAVSFDIGGLSLATNATIWIRWSDFNDANADDGIAIDDVSIGTPVDNPPTVASSNPAHNATDVAFDTAITVTFSEPVDATGSWFTFNCGTGTPTLTSSASPATTFTLTPSAPIGYSKLCTLTVLAAQISDRDGTVEFMEFNEPIQFETEADEAPLVVATSPENDAVDVSRAADLSVTFNEPVNAPGSAFGIFCPDTAIATLPFTLSSEDATTFVIDPDADLPAATDCRLLVDNLQVTDQDGVAQNPELDTRVGFTTAALAPPSVVDTIPAKNSSNFPPQGDLRIEFDANVTLDQGAFDLSCVQSTGIDLSHANSGSVFTVGTGTVLVAGDSCTLTISASAVTSSDGLNPESDEIVNFTVLAATNDDTYWQNVNLSTQQQLRCSIHETIKGHTKFPYEWEKLEALEEAPAGVCPSSNYILDVYRNRCYQKVAARSNPVGPNNYNREHVWPRSLGFNTGNQSQNDALAAHNDLHMLHLSASDWNGIRDNDPYANCPGCTTYGTDVNGGFGGPGAGNSNLSNGSVFQVWDHMKGNMARAIFYMALRYEGIPAEDAHDGNIPNLELTNNPALITITPNTAAVAYMGLLDDMLLWHASDEPDGRELTRHELVKFFQGNRNPFIDHPEWATAALFGSTQPAQCVLNTQAPAANDDSYATPLNTALTVAANDGVLANDLDAEGAPLYAELVAGVSSGTLALAANGGFTYAPASSFCGSTSFTYRASDGVRLSAPRTATINVGAPCGGGNQPPVANDATFALPENSVAGTVVGTVVASDPDVGTTLTYQITGGNGADAFTMNGNQVVVANTTPLDFETSPQFVLTVTVSDGAAPTPATDTATITVNLTDANDAPTIAQALPNRTAEEGVAIAAFSVANGFADADAGSDLDFAAGNLPTGLVLDGETGQISGTPAIGTAGIVTVTITASDGALTAQQTFQYTIAAAGVPIFADGFEE